MATISFPFMLSFWSQFYWIISIILPNPLSYFPGFRPFPAETHRITSPERLLWPIEWNYVMGLRISLFCPISKLPEVSWVRALSSFIVSPSLSYSKITPSKTGRPPATRMYMNKIDAIIFEQVTGYEDEINLLSIGCFDQSPSGCYSLLANPLGGTAYGISLHSNLPVSSMQKSHRRTRIGFRVRKRTLNAFHLKISS